MRLSTIGVRITLCVAICNPSTARKPTDPALRTIKTLYVEFCVTEHAPHTDVATALRDPNPTNLYLKCTIPTLSATHADRVHQWKWDGCHSISSDRTKADAFLEI